MIIRLWTEWTSLKKLSQLGPETVRRGQKLQSRIVAVGRLRKKNLRKNNKISELNYLF